MRPVHPGEILREEIDAAGVSEGALSKALDVPLNRVTMILEGRQGITADTALRIARYFGTTPELWLNLQKTWELRRAQIEVGRKIDERVTPRQTAVSGVTWLLTSHRSSLRQSKAAGVDLLCSVANDEQPVRHIGCPASVTRA